MRSTAQRETWSVMALYLGWAPALLAHSQCLPLRASRPVHCQKFLLVPKNRGLQSMDSELLWILGNGIPIARKSLIVSSSVQPNARRNLLSSMLSFLKAIVGSGASEPALSLSNPPRAAQINTVSLGECEQKMLAWHSEPGTSQSPQNPEACREMASRALLVQSSANPAFALMRCKRRFHPWDCPCLQSIASRLEPIPVAWNNFTHFGEIANSFQKSGGTPRFKTGLQIFHWLFCKAVNEQCVWKLWTSSDPFPQQWNFSSHCAPASPSLRPRKVFQDCTAWYIPDGHNLLPFPTRRCKAFNALWWMPDSLITEGFSKHTWPSQILQRRMICPLLSSQHPQSGFTQDWWPYSPACSRSTKPSTSIASASTTSNSSPKRAGEGSRSARQSCRVSSSNRSAHRTLLVRESTGEPPSRRSVARNGAWEMSAMIVPSSVSPPSITKTQHEPPWLFLRQEKEVASSYPTWNVFQLRVTIDHKWAASSTI